MRRKKLLKLTMTASDWNSLELNNLADIDPFDDLINDISKKIKKKNN